MAIFSTQASESMAASARPWWRQNPAARVPLPRLAAMVPLPPRPSSRWFRQALALLLGLVLVLAGGWRPAMGVTGSAPATDGRAAAAPATGAPPPPTAAAAWPGSAAAPTLDRIPLQQQPFYPQLLAAAERWRSAPLSEVKADNPRDTLLNFYVVMAEVDHEIQRISGLAKRDPGLFWSDAARQQIGAVEERFQLAVQALDASAFPESIRTNMADEAALQLKQVLDYVFNNSRVPVEIPDSRRLIELNKQRGKSSTAWTWPQTGITLVAQTTADPTSDQFLFSADTVRKAEAMYRDIGSIPISESSFATPRLYSEFISTPGQLIPPKWYLRLTDQQRRKLEHAFGGLTIFQIIIAVLMLLIYGVLTSWLGKRLLLTYRYPPYEPSPKPTPWQSDRRAWLRVVLVLPILPLTWWCNVTINNEINFSGVSLAAITYVMYVIYFISASLLAFYLFEAIGRSLTEWLVRLRGGGSELQLKRVGNLVMPISRVLGALVALILIYRLLLALGLPPATVLAFSAVPGLAIGLGASKLLGNLFAGLSIQTDRPVRVGEFCRIGGTQGFVTRIGLRSMELQTLEGRVTIPNSVVDEETIVNHCDRQSARTGQMRQALELKLPHPAGFSPDHINDLIFFLRRHLQSDPDLHAPVISLDPEIGSDQGIVVSCRITASHWDDYLSRRERLIQRCDEIQEQISLSFRTIGVGFSTPPEQLRQIPDLIAAIVAEDPCLELKSCRLMTVSDYSFDFIIRLHTHHATHKDVKDAVNRFNQDLIRCFEHERIEIPFPTTTSYEIRLRASSQHRASPSSP